MARAGHCHEGEPSGVLGGWPQYIDSLVGPSLPVNDIEYRLTPLGQRELAALRGGYRDLPGRRPGIRCCVDWSEQRHHLSGALGAAITARLVDPGWLAIWGEPQGRPSDRGRRDRVG